jgi:rod shape-determining protein MreC
VYDRKTIRRRRAVLGLLVLSSLVLLTASFGASGAGGGIGAVQRGVFEIVSPIQDGASRALKPVRDLFGWAGDTLDAQGENAQLRRERAELRAKQVDAAALRRENAQMRKLLKLEQRVTLDAMGPVTARVSAISPGVFNQSMVINKGSSDGVAAGDPVVTGDGLVGKVEVAASGSATVMLLTDPDFGVSVRDAQTGVPGSARPAAGAPRELRMKYTTAADVVNEGDTIVTAGTDDKKQDAKPSLFPPDIPVGRVFRVDDPQSDAQEIHVRPFVNLREVDFVRVLTKAEGTTK